MPLVSGVELFRRLLEVADFAHTAHVGLGSRRGSSEHNATAGIGKNFTMDTVPHPLAVSMSSALSSKVILGPIPCASRSRPAVGFGEPM
jgi:hypothetical protein